MLSDLDEPPRGHQRRARDKGAEPVATVIPLSLITSQIPFVCISLSICVSGWATCSASP